MTRLAATLSRLSGIATIGFLLAIVVAGICAVLGQMSVAVILVLIAVPILMVGALAQGTSGMSSGARVRGSYANPGRPATREDSDEPPIVPVPQRRPPPPSRRPRLRIRRRR
jgi:hypothetical protein